LALAYVALFGAKRQSTNIDKHLVFFNPAREDHHSFITYKVSGDVPMFHSFIHPTMMVSPTPNIASTEGVAADALEDYLSEM
jgi:hypothetical protein